MLCKACAVCKEEAEGRHIKVFERLEVPGLAGNLPAMTRDPVTASEREPREREYSLAGHYFDEAYNCLRGQTTATRSKNKRGD